MLIDYLPAPSDLKPYKAKDEQGIEREVLTITDDKPSIQIFKNAYNSYQGLVSYFKVNSGVVKVGDELVCLNNHKTYKVSN